MNTQNKKTSILKDSDNSNNLKDSIVRDNDKYIQYSYYYTLFKDFEALGIDTSKQLNPDEFKRFETIVNDLYELDFIENNGLPKVMKVLHNERIKRENEGENF